MRTIYRATRDRLGEGLMWSPAQNALFWTDILERQLHRLDLQTDRIDSWTMPDMIGWVLERASGGLVAGIGRSVVTLSLDPFRLETIAALEPDRHDNRLNDAKADPCGNIWAGTMPMDCDKPTGALYRITPQGEVCRFDDGYCITNGPAISPDGRSFYHTETAKRTIYRFTLEDGVIRDRERFVEFPEDWGMPDGMTCDSEGGLWVAHWGGSCVSRFTPDGTRQQVIALPTPQITNCIFAGPDLDRMFVTSAHFNTDHPMAGHLFEIETGRRGVTPWQFGG